MWCFQGNEVHHASLHWPAGKWVSFESTEYQSKVHTPSFLPPPSLSLTVPLHCFHPYPSFPPFSFCSWSCSETYNRATPLAMDWHRYMKQRHMQVLIRTSRHDIVASHMVVCVFTVLVGTSHNLFWKSPQHYICVTVRLWGLINCIHEHIQIFS